MNNISHYAIPGIVQSEYTLDEAIEQVAAAAGVAPRDVLTGGRKRKMIVARHLLFKLMRDSGWTYQAIASATGFDHSSVLYAIKKIDNGQSPEIDEILKTNFLLTNYKIKR